MANTATTTAPTLKKERVLEVLSVELHERTFAEGTKHGFGAYSKITADDGRRYQVTVNVTEILKK